MTVPVTQCLIKLHEAHHQLEDYQGGLPRWCSGCGDNALHAHEARALHQHRGAGREFAGKRGRERVDVVEMEPLRSERGDGDA